LIDPLVTEEQQLTAEDPTLHLIRDKYHQLIQENDWNVAICMPSHQGLVTVWTMRSLIGMYRPPGITLIPTGCFVDVLRNRAAKEIMNIPAITHIFYIDSDIVVPFYALMRLLQRDKEVICGLYYKRAPPFSPLIYQYQPEWAVPQLRPMLSEWENRLIEIGGSGGGCLLVAKEVFFEADYPWFHINYTGQHEEPDYLSEDVQFFMKCHKAGYKTYMDTSVVCQHMNGTLAFPMQIGEGPAKIQEVQ